MADYTLKTEIGDGDVLVMIEFEYFAGTSAKLTGPMEDCYPAESPTLEVTTVLLGPSNEARDITDLEIWPGLIEQACLNHVASIGEA